MSRSIKLSNRQAFGNVESADHLIAVFAGMVRDIEWRATDQGYVVVWDQVEIDTDIDYHRTFGGDEQEIRSLSIRTLGVDYGD